MLILFQNEMAKVKTKSKGARKERDGGGGDYPDQAPVRVELDGGGGVNDQAQGRLVQDHHVPPDGGGDDKATKFSEDSRHRFDVVIPMFRVYLTVLSDLGLDSARKLITEGSDY